MVLIVSFLFSSIVNSIWETLNVIIEFLFSNVAWYHLNINTGTRFVVSKEHGDDISTPTNEKLGWPVCSFYYLD
ncbi:hypothetical protein Hanom_Chr14g01247051 [Helianthus anomalus]